MRLIRWIFVAPDELLHRRQDGLVRPTGQVVGCGLYRSSGCGDRVGVGFRVAGCPGPGVATGGAQGEDRSARLLVQDRLGSEGRDQGVCVVPCWSCDSMLDHPRWLTGELTL